MTPTIRSVAKLAGVSPATVSLALRNDPRISSKVRQRVQDIAAKEGYKPNPIVSKLISQVRASKTTNYKSTLALVNTAEHLKDVEERTVRCWINSSIERASEQGYTVDQFVLAKEPLRPARLMTILDSRGIEGLIITGPFQDNIIDSKYDLLWQRYAAVVLGERPFKPSLSCVINDQYNTVRQAMMQVRRLGYRKPALCVHPYVDHILESRLSGGFLVEQRQLPKRGMMVPYEYSSAGKDHFYKWFKQHQPDVIITLHTEIKDWLEELGVQAPRDIGLVHLDHEPSLTAWAGMNQNHENVGKAAVDMLVGKLNRNELHLPPFPKCVTIMSEWTPGPSVREQVKEACASGA
ncbi:LacI family DNA-binding transcriptional regulator [Cerasicoccus arenae]|uniref:LacI family transcriptional regulator n=1 Tax=Cerasicoccus arenae TaxID=424488 RepID=A0A8J3DCS5_9BACT|nr:LacI family DNA-binding transcriptional regulator [Cerasicoccus arenae]MBK1858037.1 LacI family DNA-binding transcriptional regulator [Cerasicoccus arenae]GHC06659.1 LacI family transcriptional regulator [Cerasicoccus arenae]